MLGQTEGRTVGRTEGRTEGRKDGRTDRSYFIGPFWLPSGVQLRGKELKADINAQGPRVGKSKCLNFEQSLAKG